MPPGLHQEWADAQLWAKQILDLEKQGHDETSQTAKVCDDFLNFFAGPWIGLVWGMGWVFAAVKTLVKKLYLCYCYFTK